MLFADCLDSAARYCTLAVNLARVTFLWLYFLGRYKHC